MKKQALNFVYGIIILNYLFSIATAKDIQYFCPSSIQSVETSNIPSVDKWQIISDKRRSLAFSKHKLKGVDIYVGHPNDMGALIPDIISNNKDQKLIWEFPKSGTDRYWLACVYTNTTLIATQELSEKVHSCQVITHKLADGIFHNGQDITCQQL
jgi:hypothetical protein